MLGWCIPGIPGGPTWAPPSGVSCGTVQLVFDFLLHHIFFIVTRFSSCSLTFQLVASNLVSANTFSKFFAIFAPFLCSKLDFPQFAANLLPAHYLRNGPALAFLSCLLSSFFLYLREVSSYQRPQLRSKHGSSSQLSSAQQRTAALV